MDKTIERFPTKEGQHIEFKIFSGGISERELSRTMCAFANSLGGEIHIGVTDLGDRKGISATPEILDRIQNAAREGCSPPVHIELTSRPVPGHNRQTLSILVPRSSSLHSVADGQTFIRVGSQDKRVLGDELLRLAESKSEVSYEDYLLDCGTETLEMQALEEYAIARQRKSFNQMKLTPEDLLIKVGMAVREDDKFKIRAGAFILFGREGEDVVLQRDVTFVVYGKDGGMYTNREDLSLPVARLVARVMELLSLYNRSSTTVVSLKREEKFPYPQGAVREALLNAIAHRDYRIKGLRSEIRVYPDRLEFISPGGLPGFMTLENLESQHYSRNPKIAHALLTLGYVEELGQGIDLMKKLLKANGNQPPEFEASPDRFKVTFRHARKIQSSIAREEDVLSSLKDADGLTRQQIEARTGLKSTTLKKILSEMIKRKLITRTGRGRAIVYRS